MKGHISKDDLIVEVTESISGLYERPNLTKTGNLCYFTMPNLSSIAVDQLDAIVNIYYKGEQLYQTGYVYSSAVDGNDSIQYLYLFLIFCFFYRNSQSIEDQ